MSRTHIAFGVAAALLIAGCSRQSSTVKQAPKPAVAHHATVAPLTPVRLNAPDYPVSAIGSGVAGSILVCFTVKADGSVASPFIRAVSSDAVRKYFGKGALTGIIGWKFHPWIVDGEPVNMDGVCESLNYGAGGTTKQQQHTPLTPLSQAMSLPPPAAMAKRIEGSILVCFTVEADGSVADLRVKSASSQAAQQYLAATALKAVSGWKYYPWRLDGKPVAIGGICKPVNYMGF